jgi:hypothetical protein
METTRGSSKKQRQREQLIAALLTQPNLEKAAAAAGMSVSTAYRIRRTPEFQAEYLGARRELVSQAGARLQQACAAASSVLMQIMVDRSIHPAYRVRASTQVLEQSRKLLESEDQEFRLQQIERQLAGLLNKGRSV